MADFDAVILGASGYGGGELLRLLAGHPDCASLQAIAHRAAGQAIADVHPQLRRRYPGVFAAGIDWQALAGRERPVLFAALPHGEFARQWSGLEALAREAGVGDRLTVVDLSADFRLQDPFVHQQAFGQPHPAPAWLGRFAYAQPELNRAALPGARRLACPGCFATAVELALAPLSELPREARPGFVAISGMTGSSGSGASPSAVTHHPTRAADLRAYKPLRHQHLAEIEQQLRALDVTPRLAFVPHSAPLVRGIHVTAAFELDSGIDLRAALARCFAGAAFVDVIDTPPRVAGVAGSNRVEIAAFQDADRACILLTLDNLLKGMAGQAIQALNLALGLDESAGLAALAIGPC